MPVHRCLLLAVALSVALGAGTAHAGPGVTVFSPNRTQPATLSGSQISRFADVGPRSYTLRENPGDPATKLSLRGLSIRGLLSLAGLNPNTVNFVTVVRADGSLLALSRADWSQGAFPEGPALVSDQGGTTRFFRPVRDLEGTNGKDNIETTNAGPLEISVDGGGLLAIKATASPKKVKTGQMVTFTARVRFPPPGASLTYEWNFGDGASAVGPTATHAYEFGGDMQAQVSVRGSNGATARCKTTCGGVAAVDVKVGEPPTQPTAPDTSAGAGTGNPLAPGSSTGTGSGGLGGSGGGTGTGTGIPSTTPERKRRSQPKPKQPARVPGTRPDSSVAPPYAGPRITGLLLDGQAALPTAELPKPEPVPPRGGKPTGVEATRGGSDERAQVGGGVALVLATMLLGALRERRSIKLRVA